MKRAKLIGLMAGLMALAAGMGVTYAWFTNTATGTKIDVTAATISVTAGEIKTDDNNIAKKLPGEAVDGVLTVKNTGSREAVVKITPTILKAVDGKKETIDKERLAKITKDFKIILDKTKYPKMYAHSDGSVYVWMDAGATVEGKIAITLTGEFGGYYKGTNDARSPLVPAEQKSVFTFEYEAYAVQGTQDAVKDIWGNETYISALTDVMFPNIP